MRWVVYRKVVEKAASRWNGALRNTCGAIHPGSSILVETMPVDCAGIGQLVRHIDQQSVAAVYTHGWTRIFPVDHENLAQDT